MAALGRRRPFAEVIARHHDLADDLGRCEVAHQALGAGVAELAGEGAADLAGDAERAAILLGRSEEHTSELQSLMRISYAVLCLKQKNKQTQQHIIFETEN